MRLCGECLCPLLFKVQFILERLCRDSALYQKSAQANIETVIQCNWEVDQGSDRNLRYASDQFAAAYVAKDNLAYWQSSSVCDCKKLRLFRFSMGGNQFKSVKAWRRRVIGSWIHVKTENWIESTGSRWSSSEQFSQDSPLCRSSLRFRKWCLKWSVNLSTSKDELSSCRCVTTLYGRKSKQRNLCCEFSYGCRLCSKIRARPLVVSWAGVRKEAVRNSRTQAKWRTGRCCWYYDD